METMTPMALDVDNCFDEFSFIPVGIFSGGELQRIENFFPEGVDFVYVTDSSSADDDGDVDGNSIPEFLAFVSQACMGEPSDDSTSISYTRYGCIKGMY